MSNIYLHVHNVLWPIDTAQNTVSPYSFTAFRNDLHIQGKLSMGVQMCSFIIPTMPDEHICKVNIIPTL